jgi:hypothetical protein
VCDSLETRLVASSLVYDKRGEKRLAEEPPQILRGKSARIGVRILIGKLGICPSKEPAHQVVVRFLRAEAGWDLKDIKRWGNFAEEDQVVARPTFQESG